MKKTVVIAAIITAIIAACALTVNALSAKNAVLPTTSEVSAEYTAATAKEIKSRKSYGRVYIPGADIDVALFNVKDLSKLQSYVDAEDSAAMFKWNDGNTVVADHSNQGFGGLRSYNAEGYCYIVTSKGIEVYRCVEKIANGWNLGTTLAFEDKTAIGTKYNDNLVIYTCNNKSGTRVTITVWEKVESDAQGNVYTVYTVKSGESLWSIAYKLLGNGNRYTEIMTANNLTSKTVSAGTTLLIPANN